MQALIEPGLPLEGDRFGNCTKVDEINCLRRVFLLVGFSDFLNNLFVFLKVNDSLSFVAGSIVTCLVDVDGDRIAFSFWISYWSILL